jgi:hypothetical protein
MGRRNIATVNVYIPRHRVDLRDVEQYKGGSGGTSTHAPCSLRLLRSLEASSATQTFSFPLIQRAPVANNMQQSVQ